MLGRCTLLVNPPLINGVAFTRQGRCQEREDVLGTTKPPYTLALARVAAARRRVRRAPGRCDRRAARDRRGRSRGSIATAFAPTLIIFPEHDADAGCRRRRRWPAEAALRRADVLLRTACVDGARGVDGARAGGRRHVRRRAGGRRSCSSRARLDSIASARSPSLTWRRGRHRRAASRARQLQPASATMPYPAWDLVALDRYALPLVNKPYVIVETSRGCPYTCDFCVAPIHQGHKFRERSAKVARRRDRAQLPRARRRFLLSVGRHRHAQREVVHGVLRRAHRAQPAHPVVRQRARGQPDRSGLRPPAEASPAAGCWRSASSRSPTRSARTWSSGSSARRFRRRSGTCATPASARSRSSSSAIPGETLADDGPHDRLRDRARSGLRELLSGGALSGHRAVREVRARRAAAAEAMHDWSKMEYPYYLLRGNGLDERVVMDAINRAKRRFFLRPGYMAAARRRRRADCLDQTEHRLAGADAHVVRRAGRRYVHRRGAASIGRDGVTATSAAGQDRGSRVERPLRRQFLG